MNVRAILVDPEPSASTSTAVTSASVHLEPREIPTLAVGSRTSARQAHVDSTPSAGVREAHLGKIHSLLFHIHYKIMLRCECPQGFEGNPKQQCLGERLMSF